MGRCVERISMAAATRDGEAEAPSEL